MIKVLQGQTFFDIAIQELGSAEGAFELAVLNGLSVTDDLDPGQELQLPAVVNRSISEYYANKGIKPATGFDSAQPTELPRVFFEELSIEFT
jgi:hypothetical protein